MKQVRQPTSQAGSRSVSGSSRRSMFSLCSTTRVKSIGIFFLSGALLVTCGCDVKKGRQQAEDAFAEAGVDGDTEANVADLASRLDNAEAQLGVLRNEIEDAKTAQSDLETKQRDLEMRVDSIHSQLP